MEFSANLCDLSIRPPQLAIARMDQVFAHLRGKQQRLHPALIAPATDKTVPIHFDHAYAAVLPYATENGLFIMHLRDFRADWNPNRIAISGSVVGPNELPSAAVRRALAIEIGLDENFGKLFPLRFYIETRTRVPVLRCIYVFLMDRIPAGLLVGENPGTVLLSANRVQDISSFTLLSEEDLRYFLDYWYPAEVDEMCA